MKVPYLAGSVARVHHSEPASVHDHDPPFEIDDRGPDIDLRGTGRVKRTSGRQGALLTISLLLFAALVVFLAIHSARQPQPEPVRADPAQATNPAGYVLPTILAVGVFGVIIGVVLLLYLLPSVIAYQRGHQNAPAITALNILLGWAFIGWVGALVWALTEVKSREHQHHHYHN